MKRKYIILGAMLAVCGSAFAQSKGRNTLVTVENEYSPEVINVAKKGDTPKIAEEPAMNPLALEFNENTRPFKGFTSERDATGLMPMQEGAYPGYARLGYGLTNEIDAKVSYSLRTSDNGRMDMQATFDGFKSDIEGIFDDWNSRMYKSGIGACYEHRFKALDLNVGADFNNRVFNYQNTGGINHNSTDKQNSRSYRITTNGVSRTEGDFFYRFDGGVTYNRRSYSSGTDEGTGELGFRLGGAVTYRVEKSMLDNLGVELGYDGFVYNSTLRDAENGYTDYSSFDVNPFLNFNFKGWKVKIGTRMNFVTGNGARFAIAPDLKFEGSYSDKIGLYAEVTGGRTANSLFNIEKITPYWGFDKATSRQLKPTYRVVDITAGSRINLEPVSFDFYAGYKYTKDDILQCRADSKRAANYALIFANLDQENTHNTFIGGRAGCDVGGWLQISAEARYDYWSCDNEELLVMKPQITADLNAEIRFFENVTMRAGYNFTRYTKSDDNGRINNRNDLYARISYQPLKWLGAYIQGNNLLNSKYYEYAGYETRGARGSLGVTVNF